MASVGAGAAGSVATGAAGSWVGCSGVGVAAGAHADTSRLMSIKNVIKVTAFFCIISSLLFHSGISMKHLYSQRISISVARIHLLILCRKA
jgi:NhaP-type Na+/H+ or K+/H+ antiporter